MTKTYTRDELVWPVGGPLWWACGLCKQANVTASDIEHAVDCPFADPMVDRVRVEGLKRMADHSICGRCEVTLKDCPACVGHGIGWSLTTHEHALKICERYRKHYGT